MIKKLPINFWSFASSQLIANLADGMIIIMFTLLTSRVTNSPVLLGTVVAALSIPWLLLSAFIGPFIDRVGSYSMIKFANLSRFVIMILFIVIVFLDFINLPTLMILAFLMGVFEVISDNSYSVMLPEVVESNSLEKANSVTNTAEIFANRFIGVNIGSFLLGISITLALGIGSFFYLLAVILLLVAYRVSFKNKVSYTSNKERERESVTLNFKNYISDMKYGFNFLKKQKKLILLLVVGFVWNYAIGVQRSFFVLYFINELNFTEQFFSFTLSIVGLGGIMGGLSVGYLIKKLGKFKVLAIGILFCAMQYFLRFSLVGGFAFITASLFEGGADIFYNTISVSYRQRIIPKEYLGRVTTLLRFVLIGSISLGSLTGGVIAENMNFQFLGILLGIAIIIVGGIALAVMKDIDVEQGQLSNN